MDSVSIGAAATSQAMEATGFQASFTVPGDHLQSNLDDALLAHLMWVAKRIGQACERAFEAPRAGLMIAGFEVDHLHIHVMPAWGEAQLNFANAAASVPADELEANTERIRAALTELGYAEDIPADIHSAG